MWTASKRLFSTVRPPLPPGGRRNLFLYPLFAAPGVFVYFFPDQVNYLKEMVLGKPEPPPQPVLPKPRPIKPIEVKPPLEIKSKPVELPPVVQVKEKDPEVDKPAQEIPTPIPPQEQPKHIPEESPVLVQPELKIDPPVLVKQEERVEPPKPLEVPSPPVVQIDPVPAAESVTQPEHSSPPPATPSPAPETSTSPPLTSQDLSSLIESLKTEMQAEQQRRENELYDRLEASFTTLLSEFTPKIAPRSSPAQVISAQMDFSKATLPELQQKYEALIQAYEDRLENLGVKNYDSFIERLKVQKSKWRGRMEQLQREYEQEIAEKIRARDDQWREKLNEEAFESQKHYETQAKIDEEYVQQETELNLTNKFKEELEGITATLKEATEGRLRQLEEIVGKIKDMEQIQEDHYRIILRLTDIHKMHVSIENMQRALLADQGDLTADIKAALNAAKSTEIVQQLTLKLQPYYQTAVEKGIPTVKQIQKRFEEASTRARRAALIRTNNLLDVLMSRIAIKFIPSNVRIIDESNTFSILKEAESLLDAGNLLRTLYKLEELKGLPAEEMKEILDDIRLRFEFSNLVEVLSANTIAEAQKTLSNKILN